MTNTHVLLVLVTVASVFGVTACAHNSGGQQVCISHFGKTCTAYEYRPSASEQMWEDSARESAYREGRPYDPPQRPGETFSQHFERSSEEHARQDALSHGESYIPKQKSGESTSSWMKRWQSPSSASFSSSSSSSGYGSSSGSSFGSSSSSSSGSSFGSSSSSGGGGFGH